MSFKRFWVMFVARNKEFFRDSSALGWNFLFPFLIVVGFGVIFGGKEYNEFKVGVFPSDTEIVIVEKLSIPKAFRQTRLIQFIGVKTLSEGVEKLRHHAIDFLIKADSPTNDYWVSDTSPKGYLVEKLFHASLYSEPPPAQKQEIRAVPIRYVEWLFPGVLGMNIMFGALWGVGYIIVRYRKIGVLKRLKATPLTAFEYLSAQLLSRIVLMMFMVIVVWIGCDAIFHFKVEGSYGNIVLVFFLGSLSMCAMGLMLAARGTSEEFSSGLINFISWPMMFLSEVWFSLEGSPQWVKTVADFFPLIHLTRSVRKIMNDGAGLMNLMPEITAMLLTTAIFLALAAVLFSWNE